MNVPILNLWLLQIITALSAFLLFQIELIIAKIFLPHYGGSYLVWGACVVFFQAVLLLGYLFAHSVIQKIGTHRYILVHLVLIFVPLLFFPGRPIVVESAESSLPLSLDIFLRLCKTIGPVFFVLSTISITTQKWLSDSNLSQKFSPYTLYAASNLGSFLALLTYPFMFEAYWDLTQQLNFWRIFYLVVIVLNILAWRRIHVVEKKAVIQERAGTSAIAFSQKFYWFLLGLAGVVIFLSTNNIITNEIAPVPLLWIIPLGLYLLSFVFNFRENPWCPSWIVRKIYIVLGFAGILFFLIEQRTFPIAIALILLCGMQFILCMYCQNRLISLRPRDDRHLTFFYVIFSFGGFLGGVLTTWIIPLVSHSIVEYLVGLIIIGITLVIDRRFGRFYLRLRHVLWVVILAVIIWVWPLFFSDYNFWGLLLLLALARFVFTLVCRRSPVSIVLILVLMLGIVYYPLDQFSKYKIVEIKRNYYGISRVLDIGGIRRLYHSETLHGAQYLDEARKKEMLTYFSPRLPAGELLSSNDFSFGRIGIMGLGVGTLSGYGRPGQTVDFYELDPDIYKIADRHFTYLKDSAAKLNFLMGDARRSLEKNETVKYDLLIMDAFGGDSIPFHLVTKEAVALYREHLNPGGMVLIHISNRYLDLTSTLAQVGISMNAHVAYKTAIENSFVIFKSTWVAFTWDDNSYQTLRSKFNWETPDPKALKQTRVWSDKYINILPTIKFIHLLESIKYFMPFYW